MRFKDTKLSVPEIARMLGVDAIVEGSVMRESDRIRVHAQLIRAETDEHFWSEAYDQQLRDVLTLQSEVAESIAKSVEVSVTGEEHTRLMAVRPVSPDVYETYLKGKDEFVKGHNRAGFEKSIAYFEDAIEKDAMFAPAYVGLAAAYIRLGTNLVGASPDEAWPKAISAARKALELDPGQAEPHALLAEAYERQWQWSEAETELQRALEIDPNDVDAQLGFARWLLYHGRIDEALAWSERAGKLDPFGIPNVLHPWILIHARRYGEAIRELRTVLAAEPDLAVAHWHLGYALVANGQADEAIPTLEKARELTGGSPAVLGVLVRAYAHAGRRADALRLLAELKRRQQTAYVPPAAFVNAYLGLGENEEALAWLEKGFKGRSSMLAFLKVDPYFDPLRGDPSFKDLVHRVGLD
jgi:tetratricopeptide (TPR) repeat protein